MIQAGHHHQASGQRFCYRGDVYRKDSLVKTMSHLHNETFYCKLNDNPTGWYTKEITSFLINMMDNQVYTRPKFTKNKEIQEDQYSPLVGPQLRKPLSSWILFEPFGSKDTILC